MVLVSWVIRAQSPTSVWTLGDSITLEFDSTLGPSIAGLHSMYGIESIATLNDINGNLLAYSNGYRIWNRDHELLQGVEGLDSYLAGGSGSSVSSSTVFVPTSDQRYYWFLTITGVGVPSDSLGSGILASLVDITLDGGKGGIVDSKKNLIVRSNVSEYLHVVRHANSRDWWIYSRSEDIGSTLIYKDLLSDTGSIAFPPEELGFELRGRVGNIATSPCGCYLALAGFGSVALEDGGFGVYNLDRSNGALTRIGNVTSTETLYGIEFSESGNYLYVSSANPQRIYQIDYLPGSPFTIDTVYSSDLSLVSFGQLRRGDDGLIYFPITDVGPDLVFDDYLGAIESPDLAGASSEVNPQYFFLDADPSVASGLPAFPNYVKEPGDCFDSVGTWVSQETTAEGTIFKSNVGSVFDLDQSLLYITVYDLQGRPLVQYENPSEQIDLSLHVASGNYIATARNREGYHLRQRIAVVR